MSGEEKKRSWFDSDNIKWGVAVGIGIGLTIGVPVGNVTAVPSSSEAVEREREVEEVRALVERFYDLVSDERLDATLTETTRSAVATSAAAFAEGDRVAAITELPDTLQVIAEDECRTSGVRFEVSTGDLVRNCETGMDVVIGSLNSNTMLTAVIGDRPVAEGPGGVFNDKTGRFPDCRFRYHSLVDREEPLRAYVSFDCTR